MTEIPQYPAPDRKREDPVARSMSKADACAKPCTMGNTKGVRIRPMLGDKSLRRKRKKHDPRDVKFY